MGGDVLAEGLDWCIKGRGDEKCNQQVCDAVHKFWTKRSLPATAVALHSALFLESAIVHANRLFPPTATARNRVHSAPCPGLPPAASPGCGSISQTALVQPGRARFLPVLTRRACFLYWKWTPAAPWAVRLLGAHLYLFQPLRATCRPLPNTPINVQRHQTGQTSQIAVICRWSFRW